MTFINSSFLEVANDLVNELLLLSVLLCFELMLRRLRSPRSERLPGPSSAAARNDEDWFGILSELPPRVDARDR